MAIDAVLAGTKGFAVALFAPLTARIGIRPRVAADPGQVSGLCSGPSALAVVEFTGEGLLQPLQALVRGGVWVVVGLPPQHAGAEGTLRALGVEVGIWDGKSDGVIAAVERAVAAMNEASEPVAQPVAPARSAPPAPPAPRPPAPRPPAVAPPAPAGARLQPPAVPVAPRPSMAQAAPRPPGSPAQPVKPAAAAGQAQRPPAPSPRPTVPPGPAATPEAPAATAPTAATPPASAPAKPRPPPQFFGDLDEDVSVDVGDLDAPDAPPASATEVPPAPDFRSASVYVPPPPAPKAPDWPAAICTAEEAENALRQAVTGTADSKLPLHALAVATLDALSDLERAVLSGEPQPVNPEPIRKAAILRLRVADGLASAPPAGSAVESTALSAILGEIDALLAEVALILSSAPKELAPALEAIRNALVREAIDFSEAAQRVAAGGTEAAARPAAPVASARAASARVLSYDSAQDLAIEKQERRRRWVGFAVLGLVMALAVAYHGWRHYARSNIPRPPSVPGAPSNSVGSAGAGKVQIVVSRTGKFDPAELQRFKSEQELRGKRVEEVSPGVLKITPASEPRK